MAQPAKKAAARTPPTEPPALARASESGDPTVHQLLAELQTARMNDDSERASVLVGQLAELGYE